MRLYGAQSPHLDNIKETVSNQDTEGDVTPKPEPFVAPAGLKMALNSATAFNEAA